MPRVADLPCASCGKLMWRGTTSAVEGVATCQPCRRSRWQHGTRGGYRSIGCRCDECKAWNTEQASAYRRNRKSSGIPINRPQNFSGICAACGSAFQSREPKKYCTIQCAGAAKRKPAPSKALVHVGPRPSRPAPAAPTVVIKGGAYWSCITSGPCAWCGENFTALSGSARFCSQRCSRKSAVSRRGREFVITPRARLALYERDGWICQLCNGPIDRDAHYLDDWAPSLDHIIPQSHTLIPDHSASNLRTAHRWCNAVRGDGRWHADLFEEAS